MGLILNYIKYVFKYLKVLDVHNLLNLEKNCLHETP